MLIQGDVIKNGTTVAVRLKWIFICITHGFYNLRISYLSVLPNAMREKTEKIKINV